MFIRLSLGPPVAATLIQPKSHIPYKECLGIGCFHVSMEAFFFPLHPELRSGWSSLGEEILLLEVLPLEEQHQLQNGISHECPIPVSHAGLRSHPLYVKVFPQSTEQLGSPPPKRRRTLPVNQGAFQGLSSPCV